MSLRRPVVIPRHIEHLLYRLADVRSRIHVYLSKYEYEELLELYREILKTLVILLPQQLKRRFKLEAIDAAKSVEELDKIASKLKTAIDRYYSRMRIEMHGYEIEEWLKNI